MKVHRVHLREAKDGSHGYEHFTVKDEADKLKRSWERDHKESEGSAEIETIDIELTKAGILAALNKYASHPNNG